MYWWPLLCGLSTPGWSFKVPTFAVQTYGPPTTQAFGVIVWSCLYIHINYPESVFIHHIYYATFSSTPRMLLDYDLSFSVFFFFQYWLICAFIYFFFCRCVCADHPRWGCGSTVERDLPVPAAGAEPCHPVHDLWRTEEAAEERRSQGGEGETERD